MVKYLSQQWLDACCENFNASPAMRKSARGKLNVTFQHQVTSMPGGKSDLAFYSIFKDGKSQEMRLGTIESPDITLSADYAVWKDIHQGRAGMITSWMKGGLRVDAPKVKALRLALKHFGLFKMNELIAAIPTKF